MPLKTLNAKQLIKTIKRAGCDFKPEMLDRITAIISTVIPSAVLEEVNQSLVETKRRPLTLEDISRIAYVHVRSIHENDGYSPYKRIAQYCRKAEEVDFNNDHIRYATDILLDIEFMRMTGDAQMGQKGKAGKWQSGKSRRYALNPEVKEQLFGSRT